MWIAKSAIRHGINPDDIHHALRHYVKVIVEQGDAEVAMFIGPAHDGSMLEIGVVLTAPARVIHAMHVRAKFWP